jgi:hypothetical protein
LVSILVDFLPIDIQHRADDGQLYFDLDGNFQVALEQGIFDKLAWEDYTLPWRSLQQAKWGHSPSGVAALGKEGVKEWDRATPKGSLTKKHVMPRKRKRNG